jgi:hypothetical protein
MSTTAANTISGVHLGTWTNWSHGPIYGATLTLTRRNGGLLSAFITLFVTYVGTRFWRIVCFLIHHTLSAADSSQDGLYHQRQAILRNSSTGLGGIWAFLQLIWAWKRHSTIRNVLSRLVPIVSFSFASITGFAVAGIFSSQISTKSGNEVLVSSVRPGFFDIALDTNVSAFMETVQPWASRRDVQDANYARQCYQPRPSDVNCPTYVKHSLPIIATRNASCPF